MSGKDVKCTEILFTNAGWYRHTDITNSTKEIEMNSTFEPTEIIKSVSNTKNVVSEQVVYKNHQITDFLVDTTTSQETDECFLNITN